MRKETAEKIIAALLTMGIKGAMGDGDSVEIEGRTKDIFGDNSTVAVRLSDGGFWTIYADGSECYSAEDLDEFDESRTLRIAALLGDAGFQADSILTGGNVWNVEIKGAGNTKDAALYLGVASWGIEDAGEWIMA